MASGSDQPSSVNIPRGLVDLQGVPTGKSARLPSLRASRDLTLGAGSAKRVFLPTVPANKEKKTKIKTEPVVEENRKKRAPFVHGEGRGRGGRRDDNIIQTRSIFDQSTIITTPANSRRSSGNYYGGSGGSGGRSGGESRTSCKIKKQCDVDIDNAVADLEELLNGNFLSDLGDEENDGLSSLPILLPLNSSMHNKQMVQSHSLNNIDTTNDERCGTIQSNNAAHFLKEAMKSDDEQLVLVQLPSVLPGIPEKEVQQLPSSTSHKTDNEARSLNDFSEGHLGKIRVRKSGKVELLFGNILYNLEIEGPVSFLQDVVSVRTEGDDKHLTILGHVHHKMHLLPDYISIVDSAKVSRK